MRGRRRLSSRKLQKKREIAYPKMAIKAREIFLKKPEKTR
jgi:hypothetical protein